MNKKILIKFLFVICLTGVIIACSDDNNENGSSPEAINVTYTDSDTDGSNAKLALTYSEKELIGKAVAFETNDTKTAKMTLKSILPHEAETVIDNVALTSDGNSGYTFKGATTSALGTSFNYSGIINKEKLSLDIINVKIPVNSLGTFSLVKNSTSEATTETADGKKHRYTTYHQSFYLNSDHDGLNSTELLLNTMLGSFLESVVKDIIFNPDGNITATYAALPDDFDFQKDIIQNGGIDRTDDEWQISPINLVTYFVANSTELYLTPNLNMIMRQVEQDAANVRSTVNQPNEMQEAIAQISKWMSTGVKLTIKDNPKKEFFVYKESATMIQHRKYEGDYVVYIDKEEIKVFVPVIKTLLPILLTPEKLEEINQLTGMDIEALINTLLEAVEEANTLEIGLYLNKK